ncbi:MAG: 3-oxoacyl-ACP reductase family protein [Methanobacteriota archaeon]
MKDLEGRTALVTGASRGIGRAIAFALASEGASVAVNYLKSGSKAREVVREIRSAGGEAVAIKANVSDIAEVKKMRVEILKRFGEVEVLINNAGIHQHLKSWELDIADWENVIGTNLTSIFNTANVFAPAMKKAKWGRIVNVASVIAYVGTDHEMHYAASKGGCISATKAIALELAPHGVRVNAVAPGYIDTDMTKFSSEKERRFHLAKIPMGRLGVTSEIADAVAFLCSEKASYITGSVLHVNGGLALL